MLDEMTPKIKAVQKMQDYIAAHQTEEINLSDLANTACYSPWYCYRIFKELTGMSVSDYVRRLKLTGAARRLKESDAKVIDVALDSRGHIQHILFRFRTLFQLMSNSKIGISMPARRTKWKQEMYLFRL